MVDSEDRTRPYTVYVSDVYGNPKGSGVLFYPGGGFLYVFTCAHVVENLDIVKLTLLDPIDVVQDQYNYLYTEVEKRQIVRFSGANEVGDANYGEDLAIIRFDKPSGYDIEPTNYRMVEAKRRDPFYSLGYPNGVPSRGELPDYLECLRGVVFSSIGGNTAFTIRLTDLFINQSCRTDELEGLSGSPIWDDREDAHYDGLLGLVSHGYGPEIQLAKVHAVRSSQIRQLMKDKFGIAIERHLSDLPENEGEDIDTLVVQCDVNPRQSEWGADDRWLEERKSSCKTYIYGLQLQKAIDLARECMASPRFLLCDQQNQKELMQYLLYCYEIGDLDEEFDALEEEMSLRGFFDNYDVLRHLTRSFGRREFEETIAVSRRYLEGPEYNRESRLAGFAEAYLLLARSYVDGLSSDETVGMLIDAQERLTRPMSRIEDEALLYQMIGYVYGNCYHDYAKSVRLLKRSYQIGYDDNIILESLGAAYYFLGIEGALREDLTVDVNRLDRKSLYRARELFLSVRDKADELSWAATMRRVGLCIYNTYVFLGDNYRVLTTYQDVIKHTIDFDAKTMRDVEMKHAKVVAQSGYIDTLVYPHLHREDRILLRALARDCRLLNIAEHLSADFRPEQVQQTPFGYELKAAIRATEGDARLVPVGERPLIYSQLMNMYGYGIRLLGWDGVEGLRRCLGRIRDCPDERLVETLENFLCEFELSLEDARKRHEATLVKRPDIISWNELLNFNIRHGLLDEADSMYRELFMSKRQLIADEPEYAYRAYIEYVTTYHRDMRDALRCFLDAKKAFRDTDIMGFWELDLMFYTNTFNHPERYETERLSFVKQGLLGEEEFHRTAFIAYLTNLQEEKAREHQLVVQTYPHLVNPATNQLIMQREEIQYLNWIGALKPSLQKQFRSLWNRQIGNASLSVFRDQQSESIDNSARNQFRVSRLIAIDSSALGALNAVNRLADLSKLDKVFVSHPSVIRMLDDLSETGDRGIRFLLDFVRDSQNIEIASAKFETQLAVRDVTLYTEPASVVALAVEKDCLAVVGDPKLRNDLVEHFGRRMVGLDEFIGLLDEV